MHAVDGSGGFARGHPSGGVVGRQAAASHSSGTNLRGLLLLLIMVAGFVAGIKIVAVLGATSAGEFGAQQPRHAVRGGIAHRPAIAVNSHHKKHDDTATHHHDDATVVPKRRNVRLDSSDDPRHDRTGGAAAQPNEADHRSRGSPSDDGPSKAGSGAQQQQPQDAAVVDVGEWYVADPENVPTYRPSGGSDREGADATAHPGLKWTARDLYLPISSAARDGFRRYETKQKARDKTLLDSWGKIPPDTCLSDVPECEFFKAAELPLLFKKCCAEHTKLKRAFEYAMDVAESQGLLIFLDSGTLLSAVRDGYQTLVPWETDIDLGIVGVEPAPVAKAFAAFAKAQQQTGWKTVTGARRRKHLFAQCLTKTSKNVSRNGRCKDAHYVYYAETEEDAQRDTSRVEIWPFWPEPGTLVHPTRKKLSVDPRIVLPLRRCNFWGRRCWCPGNASGYLDHEYGADGSWRLPKTIHWGQNNVQSLKSEFTTRPPRKGDVPVQ